MADNAQDAPVSQENSNDKKPEASAATTGNESKVKKDIPERSALAKETKEEPKGESLFEPNDLGVLNEVAITLTIEIGRAQIKIRDLLNLTKGSIIELNKSAGDPVDIYANGKLIATGNIITANGKYCVRVTSVPEKNKLGVKLDGK